MRGTSRETSGMFQDRHLNRPVPVPLPVCPTVVEDPSAIRHLCGWESVLTPQVLRHFVSVGRYYPGPVLRLLHPGATPAFSTQLHTQNEDGRNSGLSVLKPSSNAVP